MVPPALLSGILGAVLYLPVLIVTGAEALGANPFTVAQTADGVWERFTESVFFAMTHTAWDSSAAIEALCIGIVIIGAYRLAKQSAASVVAVGLTMLSTFAVGICRASWGNVSRPQNEDSVISQWDELAVLLPRQNHKRERQHRAQG